MNMKSIPFQPVINNPTFFELEPGAKYYLLELIIKLGEKRKLVLPLPELRQYVTCSKTHYWRFEEVYKKILNETIPEIYKIKTAYNRQGYTPCKKHMANAAKRKLDKNRKETFSDSQDMHVEIIPTNSVSRKSWNPGQHDHVERDKAIESNKTGKEGWLKDS